MSEEVIRKRAPGLGRGLSALLGDMPTSASDQPTGDQVRHLAIASISGNPTQPRRHFTEEAIEELAASIRERGVLQPILVRPSGTGYQIVAGERRWRAAQRAGLHEIPAIIRDLEDAATFEIALIENIQREDLNPIEEAEAYRRLISDYGHTQDALAKIVNKSRSHIANLMRLLDLPPPVRAAVVDGTLSMGHARALITAPDPASLAEEVGRRGLSVRDTERLAKSAKAPTKAKAGGDPDPRLDADVASLERHLGDMLGLGVKIVHSGRGGSVTLHYASLDQLDLICQRLSGERI